MWTPFNPPFPARRRAAVASVDGMLISAVEVRRSVARVLRAVWSARHRSLDPAVLGTELTLTAPPISAAQVAQFNGALGPHGMPHAPEAECHAHPFFASRLLLPLIERAAQTPALRLNLLRMVHAEQHMTWYQPLRIGAALDLSCTIAAIEACRAGALLWLEADGRAQGQLVAAAKIGLLVRQKPPSGIAQAQSSTVAMSDPATAPPLFTLQLPTTTDQARRYALASGDENPIHTHYLVARLGGLKRPILHGMCVLAMSANAILDELRLGPAALQGISARFRGPAYPGERLVVQALAEKQLAHVRELSFQVLSVEGRPIITRGVLRVPLLYTS